MSSKEYQLVEISQSGSFNSIVVASINESSSATHLFKLNVDCFENLFEWLSFYELLAFRHTCKRMKAVVDYYIKLNYPQLLCFEIEKVEDLQHLRPNHFEWVRHLSVWNIELDDTKIDGIKYILNQLEILKLIRVEIPGDFYEVLLKHCPRLKSLGVRPKELPVTTIIGTGNEWLQRHYPTLEHFEIDTRLKCTEPFQFASNLLGFFQQNPGIRRLSSDSEFLLMCRQSLLDSKLNFDQLDLNCRYDLSDISNLMNDLHQRNFYKRLHLYSDPESISIDQAENLLAFQSLQKLHLNIWPRENFSIPKTMNMKELSIGTHGVIELDSIHQMAVKFTNIRRIYIPFGYLRAFICGALKLQEIFIWGSQAEELTVNDCVVLNKERCKIAPSHQVKIYIDEKNFLKLKWTNKINFSCIEIKRCNSRETDLFY